MYVMFVTYVAIKTVFATRRIREMGSWVNRRVAKKLHPDKGGTHDRFIRLTEAYHELLRSKGETPRWSTKQ